MASASGTAARAIRTATVVALFASGTDAVAEVGANVGARLVHADNVTLAAEGAAQSDDIVDLTAGIDFARTKPRLSSQVRYQAEALFYADAGDDEVFHTLDASSELALVLNRLYLDAYAVYDQTITDSTGTYSFNKIALTGNRTDVAIVGVSPFLLLNFGGDVTGQLRYDYSRFDYDDPALRDSDEHVRSLTLGNSGRRRGASWGVSYYNHRFEFERDIEFELFEAELGFWATDTLRLFTTQGLESDYRLVQSTVPGAAAPGLDDHYWYVGAEWRPSERQTFELETGDRNFGRSNRLAWSRQSRGGGITVSYDEAPSSFLADQVRSARSAGELTPIDALAGPNGNPFYLQKIWNVAFVLDGNRTHSGLRFFDEKRFDIARLVTDNDDEVQTETFRGTELSFSFDLNSVAVLSVSAQFARRRSSFNAINDKYTYLWGAWTRDLGRRTQLVVSVSRERSEPQGPAPGGFDYEYNQTAVGISRSFGATSGGGVPQRYSGYLNASQGR